MNRGPLLSFLWRAALRLLPRDFRRRHGHALEDALEPQLQDASRAAGLLLRVRAVVDVTFTGIRLRWRAFRTSGGARGGSAQDLRFAARGLLRRPGFAAVAVVTLALGIGANTAVFSVVHGILLEPLPYEDADRIGILWHTLGGGAQDLPAVHALDARDYRRWSDRLQDLTLATGFERILESDGGPALVDVGFVEAGFFQFFGTTAALGRTFQPEDDVPGAAPVAVLSHETWQGRFGADPDVVGRRIQLGGESVEVVGVLPSAFRLFLPAEAFRLRNAQVWVPVRIDEASLPPRNYTGYTAFARLAEGVSFPQAQAELDRMAATLRENHDVHRASELRARIEPLQADVVKGARDTLLVLLAAVGMVLLIACANVANLMLVRGESRSGELAVRTALGAGRGRLMRLTLFESLLLSLTGAVLGTGLAAVVLRTVAAWGPAAIPRLQSIGLDAGVLAFAAGMAILSTALVGLVPAILTTGRDPAPALKTEGRAATPATRGSLRRWLVAVQVAGSFVLLVGTGLLVRTFVDMNRADPGFRAEGVLTFRTVLASGTVDSLEGLLALQDELLEQIRALPGVTGAGLTSQLPLTGSGPLQPYAWNEETARAWESVTADRRSVGAEYFQVLGTRLIAGRTFTGDPATDAGTILVDDRLADRAFPDGGAVGQRLQVEPDGTPEADRYVEIVGVVEHVRLHDLSAPYLTQIWEPGVRSTRFSVAVRTDGDPEALAEPVRKLVAELAPGSPVQNLQRLEALVAQALAPVRFSVGLMTAFGVLAAVLAAVGIYGVLAYLVSRQTREIGIRLALGMSPARARRQVLREGMRIVLPALALGLVASVALWAGAAGLLFGVEPVDPLAWALTGAFLAGVALIAAWIPARRATRVDPRNALTERI